MSYQKCPLSDTMRESFNGLSNLIRRADQRDLVYHTWERYFEVGDQNIMYTVNQGMRRISSDNGWSVRVQSEEVILVGISAKTFINECNLLGVGKHGS